MQLQTAYRGRSNVSQTNVGLAVSLAPNLRRDRVSFVGKLKHPLRFREAMSALHDVVISDLRFKPKDKRKKRYEEWKKQEAERERRVRTEAAKLQRAELDALKNRPMPVGLEKKYERSRKVYWDARTKYGNMLYRDDPELWRMLMPCDPVITVSPDVIFFECFSADESSYGCLNVQRDAFEAEADVALGTTNVDYSWRLYEHFQTIRSYRETRFAIDPLGFEAQTDETRAAYARKDRPATVVAPRLRDAAIGHEFADEARASQSRGAVLPRRVPQAAQGEDLSAGRAIRTDSRSASEADSGTVEQGNRPARHAVSRHAGGSHSRVGSGPPPRPRATAPGSRSRGRVPARHGPAGVLGVPDGGDATDARAFGLDRE